jgi:putative peptidoglycan lipid II flippase
MSGALEEPATEGPPAAGSPSGLSFRSIGRSAAILTGAAAGVQVIGIIREVFVAANVGLSSGYDALLIALVIPTTFAGVLTAGTVPALVPAYLEVRDAEGGLRAARRLAGTILLWVGLSGLAIWLLLEVFGSFAIAIVGPGLDRSGRDAAVSFLHIVSPIAFVSGITAILSGICQAEQRFKVIAMASFAGAAATLAATLVLWQPLELKAIAVANLAGPVSTGIVLVWAALRSGRAPLLTIWTTRDQLATFTRHAAPLTLSSAILQFNGVVDRAIATLIGPGAVSALRYADVLVRTPIGAISPGWTTALYPSLVRVANQGVSGLGSATSRALRYVLVAFVPIAALTVAVAPIAVAVGFGRGAFTESAVALTALAVAGFAPMIVVQMCYPPFTGALNARRRGKVLLAGGVLNVVLNAIFDVVFGLGFGAPGIALSSSLTAMVVLVFFARQVARSEDDFEIAPITRTLFLTVVASLPVALPIGLLCWLGVVPGGLAVGLGALALFGAVGLLGYLLVALRLGLEEARSLTQLLGQWRASRRRAERAAP